MAKTTRRKTPEKRKAEAEELHETFTAQVEQLVTSEGWRQFLAFARSFHHYSLRNMLLILAQKPDATQVAGYRAWQEKGSPGDFGGAWQGNQDPCLLQAVDHRGRPRNRRGEPEADPPLSRREGL